MKAVLEGHENTKGFRTKPLKFWGLSSEIRLQGHFAQGEGNVGRVWVPAAAVVAVTVGGFVLLDPLTSSLQSNEQLPVTPVTVASASPIPDVEPAPVSHSSLVTYKSRKSRGSRSSAVTVRSKTPARRRKPTYTNSTSSVYASSTKHLLATPTATKRVTKRVTQKRPVSHKPVSGNGELNGNSGLADASSHAKIPTVGAQSLAPPR